MGHIYLSHSHPIAIDACPIPRDVSHGIPIGIPFPWTSLCIGGAMLLIKHDSFMRSSILSRQSYYAILFVPVLHQAQSSLPGRDCTI